MALLMESPQISAGREELNPMTAPFWVSSYKRVTVFAMCLDICGRGGIREAGGLSRADLPMPHPHQGHPAL